MGKTFFTIMNSKEKWNEFQLKKKIDSLHYFLCHEQNNKPRFFERLRGVTSDRA